jgi:hypothetical protein
LVQTFNVFDLANFPVQVQGRSLLPFVLFLERHRRIGGPWNGLVRQVDFEGRWGGDAQQTALCMPRLALHHLGFDGLAWERILDKHHKWTLFCFNARHAFAAEGHVFDAERQDLPLVKCPFDPSMSSHGFALGQR